MTKFWKNKKFKFVFWTIVFILIVIWIGNYWLLFGLPIIFDYYISKKVNWTPWKAKDGTKKNKFIEWVDAIIFAVVAATIIRSLFIEAFTIPTSSMEKSLLVGDYLFVSKVAYGPRLPMTPISFPFAHHTLPLTENTKSYLEWIELPFKRLAGLGNVQRNDVVVFNFPAGDTVCLNYQEVSYYQLCRDYGRKVVWENKLINPNTGKKLFGDIIVRPIDKQENYIKRCTAIPGDTLQIVDRVLYINNKTAFKAEGVQHNYYIKTNGTNINPKILDKYDITEHYESSDNPYDLYYTLTDKNVENLKKLPNVSLLEPIIAKKGERNPRIFPHNEKFDWNEDNFGPLYIPKKGVTIKINLNNLPLYKRIIGYYENNKLEVKDGKIFINDKESDSYTFKMNYYWMMGDNRHNSADSRFWGFVPEDHIVGKAWLIWMSLDKNKSLLGGKIRWSRIFKPIH